MFYLLLELNLVHDKKIDLLLEALSSYKDKPRQFKLNIVGDGEHARVLQDKALEMGLSKNTSFWVS